MDMYCGWITENNTVKDRLKDNSLVHTFSSKAKIKRSTKLLNKKIRQYAGIRTYEQFVNCKRKILQNVKDNVEETDESDLSEDEIETFYNSIQVSHKSQSDDLSWCAVSRKNEKDDVISEKCNSSRSDNNDEPEKEIPQTIVKKWQGTEPLPSSHTHEKLDCFGQKYRYPKRSSTSNRESVCQRDNTLDCIDEHQSLKDSSFKKTKVAKNCTPKKIMNNNDSKLLKKNISSKINDMNSKVHEPAEEETSNDEFIPSDFQAQSTKIFADTLIEGSGKINRYSSTAASSRKKSTYQPRDSGIEEDSREGNIKRNKLTNKKIQRSCNNQKSNEIEDDDYKLDPVNSDCEEQDDISDEGKDKLDDYVLGPKETNTANKKKVSLKIIGDEKVIKKYKIVSDVKKELKPIPEQKQVVEPESNIGVEGGSSCRNSDSSVSDEYYMDVEKSGVSGNVQKESESSDEYYDTINDNNEAALEDDEKQSQSEHDSASNEDIRSSEGEMRNFVNVNDSHKKNVKKKIKTSQSPYMKQQYKELKKLRLLQDSQDSQESETEMERSNEQDKTLKNNTPKSLKRKKVVEKSKQSELYSHDEDANKKDDSFIIKSKKKLRKKKKHSNSVSEYQEEVRTNVLNDNEDDQKLLKNNEVMKTESEYAHKKSLNEISKIDVKHIDNFHQPNDGVELQQDSSTMIDKLENSDSTAKGSCDNVKNDNDNVELNEESNGFDDETQITDKRNRKKYKEKSRNVSKFNSESSKQESPEKSNDVETKSEKSEDRILSKMESLHYQSKTIDFSGTNKNPESAKKKQSFVERDNNTVVACHEKSKRKNEENEKDEMSSSARSHLKQTRKMDFINSDDNSDNNCDVVNPGNLNVTSELYLQNNEGVEVGIKEIEEEEKEKIPSEVKTDFKQIQTVDSVNSDEDSASDEDSLKLEIEENMGAKSKNVKKDNVFPPKIHQNKTFESVMSNEEDSGCDEEIKNIGKLNGNCKSDKGRNKETEVESEASEEEDRMSPVDKHRLTQMKKIDFSNYDEESDSDEDSKHSIDIEEHKIELTADCEESKLLKGTKTLNKSFDNKEESDSDEDSKHSIDIEEHKIELTADCEESKLLKGTETVNKSLANEKSIRKSIKKDIDELHGIMHCKVITSEDESKVIVKYKSDESETTRDADGDTSSLRASKHLKLLNGLNSVVKSDEESDKKDKDIFPEVKSSRIITECKTEVSDKRKTNSQVDESDDDDDDDEEESDRAMSPTATQRLSQFKRMNLLDNNDSSSSEDENKDKENSSTEIPFKKRKLSGGEKALETTTENITRTQTNHSKTSQSSSDDSFSEDDKSTKFNCSTALDSEIPENENKICDKDKSNVIINETQGSIVSQKVIAESQEMFSSSEDLSKNTDQATLNKQLPTNNEPLCVESEPKKEPIREKITKISQLVESENLQKCTDESTITINDILEDEEIFLLDVPKSVFGTDLIGRKISFEKTTLQLGDEKYHAFQKKTSPIFSCVFGTIKNEKKSFKTVNIRPIVSIVAPRKKNSDDLKQDESEILSEEKIKIAAFTEIEDADITSDRSVKTNKQKKIVSKEKKLSKKKFPLKIEDFIMKESKGKKSLKRKLSSTGDSEKPKLSSSMEVAEDEKNANSDKNLNKENNLISNKNGKKIKLNQASDEVSPLMSKFKSESLKKSTEDESTVKKEKTRKQGNDENLSKKKEKKIKTETVNKNIKSRNKKKKEPISVETMAQEINSIIQKTMNLKEKKANSSNSSFESSAYSPLVIERERTKKLCRYESSSSSSDEDDKKFVTSFKVRCKSEDKESSKPCSPVKVETKHEKKSKNIYFDE